MSELDDCLKSLKKSKFGLSDANTKLLRQEIKSHEDSGLSPFEAAHAALSSAKKDVDVRYKDILKQVVDKTEGKKSKKETKSLLNSYWNNDNLEVTNLPKSQKSLATKLIEAGVKTESDVAEALGPDSAWTKPIAKQISEQLALNLTTTPQTNDSQEKTNDKTDANGQTNAKGQTDAQGPSNAQEQKVLAPKRKIPQVKREGSTKKLIGARRKITQEIDKEFGVGTANDFVSATNEQTYNEALSDLAESKRYKDASEEEQKKLPEPPKVGEELVTHLLDNYDAAILPKQTALLVHEALQSLKALKTAGNKIESSDNPTLAQLNDKEDLRDYNARVLMLIERRGSLAGAALQAQKMVFDYSFNLGVMLSDFKSWQNQGKERSKWTSVSPEDVARLTAESKRMEKVLAANEKQEKALQESIAAQEQLQIENGILRAEAEKAKTKKPTTRKSISQNQAELSRLGRENLSTFAATFIPAIKPTSKSDSTLDRMAEEAKLRLRAKRGNVSLGVDLTILSDVAIIAAKYIKDGVVTLAEVTAKLVDTLGEEYRKYAEPAFNKANESVTAGITPNLQQSLTDVAADYILNGFTKEQVKEKLFQEFGTSLSELIGPALAGVDERLKATSAKSKGKSPQEIANLIDPEKPISRTAIYNMARGLLVQKIRGKEMINTILSLINERLPDVTYNNVVDAFTGYGKTKVLSQDQIEIQLRDERRIALLNRQIEEIENGRLPSKTGLLQDTQSDEARILTKERNALMRKMRVTNDLGRTQMRGALQSNKTRYTNDIADLEKALTPPYTKLLQKNLTKAEFDQELLDLKAKKSELTKEYNLVWGKDAKQLSIDKRMAILSTTLDRNLAREEQMALDGVLTREKPNALPRTPEQLATAKKTKDLRDARHAETRRRQKEAKDLIDPPKSVAERLTDSLVKRTTTSMARANYFLEHGKFPVSEKGKPGYDRSMFPTELLKTNEELSEAVKYLRENKTPLDTLEQQNKDRAVQQLEDLRDALEEQINNKSWDTPVSEKPHDDRKVSLQATVEILRGIKERTQKLDPVWLAAAEVKWNDAQAKSLETSTARYEYYLKNDEFPAKEDGTKYTRTELVKDLLTKKNELRDTVAKLESERKKMPRDLLAARRRKKLIEKLNSIATVLQKQLESGIYIYENKEIKKDAAIKQIQEINKSLREGITELKKADPRWIASYEVQQNRALLKASEARAEMWKQRLIDKDFRDETKVNREPSSELKRSRLEIVKAKHAWLEERQKQNFTVASFVEKASHVGKAMFELRKFAKLGLDLALGRQGLIGLILDPKVSTKAWAKTLANLTEADEQAEFERMQDSARTPSAAYSNHAKEFKLFGPFETKQTKKEDLPDPELLKQFNRWIGRVTKKASGSEGLSKIAQAPLDGVLLLERINRMHNNYSTILIFERMLPLAKNGKPTQNDIDIYANATMSAMGRGSFKNQGLDSGIALVNKVLLSARWVLGGINLATAQPLWTPKGGYAGTGRARLRAAKVLYGTLLLNTSIAMAVLGAIAFRDDKEKWLAFANPISDGFGKFQWNNVTYDPLKRILPYVSLVAKLGWGSKIVNGKTIPLRGPGHRRGAIKEEVVNFFLNRQNLTLSLVQQLATWEQYDGTPSTTKSVLLDAFGNLNMTSNYEILTDDKIGNFQKAFTVTQTFFGFTANVKKETQARSKKFKEFK